MTEYTMMPFDYIDLNNKQYPVVKEIAQLKSTLEALAAQVKADATLDKQQSLVYQWGRSRAAMVVDFSGTPVQIWFYDPAGRPVPANVKAALSEFLFEMQKAAVSSKGMGLFYHQPTSATGFNDVLKTIQQLQNFHDHYEVIRAERVNASITGEQFIAKTLEDAFAEIHAEMAYKKTVRP